MVLTNRWWRLDQSGAWFPLAMAVVVGVKLILVSDLSVLLQQYGAHDDGLYVMRAYHLLTEGGFGQYDARTLVKLPGISFWLAATRLLGIPYLWSINFLYIAAGCYLLAGALQCGVTKPVALAAFVIYLFSPITMGNEWLQVMREPLSTGLLVLLFASALFILLRLQARRFPIGHLAIFSIVFAFSLLLREEDVVLYVVVLMLGVAAWWVAKRGGALGTTAMRAAVLSIVVIPLLAAAAANAATRQFIEHHYGTPLLHDFSEGEFPKLIAAIRSIESKKDNRYVMITQERLAKLVVEVPRLGPVIKRLPAPGPGTSSCLRYKVCTEWGNGWMHFWIKDAAEQAGLTPELPKAQAFFRAAREDIEQACREGRLECDPAGSGLLPPFELKWTRAYVQEFFTLLGMTAAPHPRLAAEPPERHAVDADLARVFEFVTMAHDLGTAVHAKGEKSAILRSTNPLASWRPAIGDVYRFLAPVLTLFIVVAFAVRIWLWKRIPPDPLALIIAVFMGYTLVRLAALAYVAVYFGHFDDRLVFSTHSLLLLTGPFVIADAVAAVRIERKQRLEHGEKAPSPTV